MIPRAPRLLFVHAWHGFSLAEWYLREALCRLPSPPDVRGLALQADGVPIDDRLVRTLAAFQPDLVGFSCHFWSLPAFLEGAAIVKHVRPEAKVLLGGPQVGSVQAATGALTEQRAVDFVVRGRGEQAVTRLLSPSGDEDDADRALQAVPGLSYRVGPAELRHNPEDPGAVPRRDPIFHRGNQALTEQLLHAREASYETVTGCRCRCAYCMYPTGKVRELDDEMVMAELAYLCELGVPHVRICDAHFAGSAGRAKKLLRHLARVNRRSSIKIYPDMLHVDPEYVELVGAAGAQVTSIGIQTTHRESLKRVRRPASHDARDAIQMVLSAFPTTPADVIVGLPGDTPQGLAQTFRDVLDLGFSRVNVFPLHVFPGTELGSDPARYFGEGRTVCTPRGRVLSSPGFPVTAQGLVTQLCHAVEVAAPLVRTRAVLGSGAALFNALVERCSRRQLMHIHDALYPFHPERLLKRLPALVDELGEAAGIAGPERDVLTFDLAEYLRAEAAARRCDRLEWEEPDHLRVVVEVALPLRHGGQLLWNLRLARLQRASEPPRAAPSTPDVLVLGATPDAGLSTTAEGAA